MTFETDTDVLVDVLEETRRRTLALVATVDDADLHRPLSPIMSPLVWDLAHIAAYEDLWIAHRHGGLDLLHPELAAVYDAFETPRAARGEIELLDRSQAVEYLERTRERTLEVLRRRGPGDGTLVELVVRHEQMHDETMLQAMTLGRLPVALPLPAPTRATNGARPVPVGGGGLEAVEIPGGPFTLGATDTGAFSYDNERPRHVVDVPTFRIGRTPVTNASWLSFAEGGGYEYRDWWTNEAWMWKEQYDITRPGGWAPEGGRQWRLDGWADLDPDEPVVHISWFEAEAFARAHGARLPTEAEWEKAATWDQETGTSRPAPWGDEEWTPGHANLDHAAGGPLPVAARADGASPSGVLGMLGDTWEWTASDFCGYPGFVAHPYREYSEPFFGSEYKVLRGGSWAARPRYATATFRNWDYPVRRQIFSGLRLAWDA